MPEDLLTMSAKEVDRAGLIHRVLEGRLSQVKAAEMMGLSARQRPHQPRFRRECLGELVQIDGRLRAPLVRPRAQLLPAGYVDDATSRLMELRFVPSESTFDYFDATRNCHDAHRLSTRTSTRSSPGTKSARCRATW